MFKIGDRVRYIGQPKFPTSIWQNGVTGTVFGCDADFTDIEFDIPPPRTGFFWENTCDFELITGVAAPLVTKHCICDFATVILVSGCQCGGLRTVLNC